MPALPEVTERPSHGEPTWFARHRGWLGVRLDLADRSEGEVDRDAVDAHVEDAYRAVAPTSLVPQLDERRQPRAGCVRPAQ